MDSHSDPKELLRRGREAEAQGHLQTALRFYNEACALAPFDDQAFLDECSGAAWAIQVRLTVHLPEGVRLAPSGGRRTT